MIFLALLLTLFCNVYALVLMMDWLFHSLPGLPQPGAEALFLPDVTLAETLPELVFVPMERL